MSASLSNQLAPESEYYRYLKLQGCDFVCEQEEYSGEYHHVFRVLPFEYGNSHARTSFIVHSFRIGRDESGKRVRKVFEISNRAAEDFCERHRQVELRL